MTSQTYGVIRGNYRRDPVSRPRMERKPNHWIRGKPADAACRSDRDDPVLDGEMDQLCAALQFERIHHLIFVVLDGSR